MSRREGYAALALAISEIQEKMLKPDLMKDPKGNNFRAISEHAILECINPILKKNGIDYYIEVLDHKVEFYNGKYVATCKIRMYFYDIYNTSNEDPLLFIDSLGMGIDREDKAIGKAYTYAVKYALLKKFRLLYADDPDFSSSNDNEKKYHENEKKEENKQKNEAKTKKSSQKEEKTKLVTEKMTDYIIGLAKDAFLSDEAFEAEFGFKPFDPNVSMQRAREVIDELKKRADDLPF